MVGGYLADSAIALNVLLSRLYWKKGKIPIRSFYRDVRKLTGKERRTMRGLPGDEATWRKVTGVLPDVGLALKKKDNVYEQTWRKPAVTVIAQEASSIKGASNQVLPKANGDRKPSRIVPDQDPEDVYKMLERTLTKDPPWNVKVTCTPTGACKWWMTDPTGPAFEAALASLEAGYGVKPVATGRGGKIGLAGSPRGAVRRGRCRSCSASRIRESNAHAPNESIDRGIVRKLTASIAHLFDRLGNLPDGKVR